MPDHNQGATDLACSRYAVLLWWLPVAALVVGANWPKLELLLWFPAFLVMGAACLANAARCGRIHCYATGPLFLIASAYVALHGFRLVPMQTNFFMGSIVAVFLLARLAEIPLGKYKRSACGDQPKAVR